MQASKQTHIYEINFTIALQEFVEAESIEDAEQVFSELYTTADLMEHGEVTVTLTDLPVE